MPETRTPYRLLNPDGTFNVERVGCSRTDWRDAYHTLLRTSWPRFLFLVALLYLTLNGIFATLYAGLGSGALSGVANPDFAGRFERCFFFSVQTFATIGYGGITPVTRLANVLVTGEALVGLLFLALATGLLFARFSRPTARVVFSRVAIVQEHDGQRSLLFRMANLRLNQIAEAQVSVVVTRDEVSAEGERYRNFHDLALERSRSPIFALSWTIVHPIDEQSPLHGMTAKHLEASDAEIIVTLTGIDDTFSQTIHARYSYKPEDLRWDRQFADILGRSNGKATIDIGGIHDLLEEPGA